ncbi:DUF948 domain-containing protein [Streptomyces sp. B6B3]|uniref:DUF948 domain-containing protein n=1 Tax=Streptomyces sp. B6B3 TaxID=3153570 RepID=UPI00325ED132
MSGGEVAGLLVAVFWAILVSFLAVALVRLAQALRAATTLVHQVTERAVPLLGEASDTVRAAQGQLDRVETITADVQEAAANASALSTTVASTFGGPLVKVAAFGYGVRRALGRAPAAAAPPADPSRSGDPGGAPADRRTVVGRTLPPARRRRRGKD